MRNLVLPNPSQPSDTLTLILQALLAIRQPKPSVIVTPLVAGSTTYDYIVVANSNGVSVSGTGITTTGASTVSAANSNTINWSAVSLNDVTYDIYRSVGGTSQGKIVAGLTFAPGAALTFVDTGFVGDSTTAPSFNTTGILAASVVEKFSNLTVTGAAAIDLLSGTVFLSGAGATLATLPQPIAGTPDAGGQDGATITIICTTAHAHTVTTAANGINGNKHILTFAALGDNETLTALGGVWYTSTGNATVS